MYYLLYLLVLLMQNDVIADAIDYYCQKAITLKKRKLQKPPAV